MCHEESDDYAAKKSMVGIQLFVREAGKILNGRPRFEGESVMKWELRGSNDSEAFG